jgi:hypothetical protein
MLKEEKEKKGFFEENEKINEITPKRQRQEDKKQITERRGGNEKLKKKIQKAEIREKKEPQKK